MTEHRARIESDPFRVFDRMEAMALPQTTPTKVYAEFRLLAFDIPNANKDGFLAADVTDEAVATLQGSPIYGARDLGGHPQSDARATDRAAHQVGTVILAERRGDGVYCLASLQREFLADLGVDPKNLTEAYSVSMETLFDRTKAKYRAGGRTMSYAEAFAAGITSTGPDDRERYDVRFITPREFHAVALLHRGKNADPRADFLRVAADRDESDPFRVSPETIRRTRGDA